MSKEAQQITNSELMKSIDAAGQAGIVHQRETPDGTEETIMSTSKAVMEPHIGLRVKRVAREHGGYTTTDITAFHPPQADRGVVSEYHSEIRDDDANTTIIRRDETGDEVYRHQTEDLQLARRLGKFGADSATKRKLDASDQQGNLAA